MNLTPRRLAGLGLLLFAMVALAIAQGAGLTSAPADDEPQGEVASA